MLMISLLLGGILVLAGIVTYIFAPRVGPNPIFGVRIGYAYANRETWDKTNRFGGMLMAMVGIGTAIVGFVLQLLNIAGRDATNVVVVVMLAALVAGMGWVFFYARGLAQGTSLARQLVPVKFRWAYLAPTLITLLLFIAFAVYIYPALPVDRVPSHFNLNDQPDGWQSRNEFIATFLGMSVLFLLLNVLIVFVAAREPMISFSRWGTAWRLDPERGLVFAGLAFALANLIFIAILWNVWWLVTWGALAFSFWWILAMIVPLVAAIIGLFFVLGRKEL